ncbi:MAG: cadherin-like beta sandwich domain-containing protein, partial [Bacillota bacterium]|nr:cadherin-like beta sandwich domain-containing protein [Bacillota bacterium]
EQTDSSAELRFRAKATDSDATVKIYYYGEGSKDITWSSGSSKWANCLTAGKNTFTIAVEPKDSAAQEGTTYTFSINCVPTLTGLSVASGDTQLYLDQNFSAATREYTMSVPETAETVTVAATPRDSGYQVLYNGESSNIVDIKGKDEIAVEVSTGEGVDKISSTYTIKLNKVKQLDFSVKATPSDAVVKVYDQKGVKVEANQDGSFSGMFAEYEYTYTVTRYGYVGQSGTVPEDGGQLTVTLEKAPDDGLNDVNSDWENFRNSDTNMGITNAQTPISVEDTTLLWSAKLGSGWMAAPSVQIIVDDALIVMSGKNIYKLDLKSGEILKTGTMTTTPSYGYTPPIYAEGMIICPLGSGTIQAFNAETLESLWIYKDSLKGQSLSPITYSDGYIYTGFWNSDTKDANYVCISITDENPSKTDEAKLATWKHTQAGGFYWAGSVVVGNVTIVGTDDGVGSSSTGNAQLYAFNKTTGEIISSIDLESVGDQRSSIAYDKTSGKIYFTTKGGYLCSAKVNASTGVISDLKKVDYNAQSTSTPIVYKGKV